MRSSAPWQGGQSDVETRDRALRQAVGVLPDSRHGVWILDKGRILWRSGTTDEWLTAQPGEVWIQSTANLPGESPLPLMAMQLQGIFQSVFMPPFRIGDYMGDMPIGLRDVIGPEHPASMPPWLKA
jgi:hypothetical protein